MKNSGSMSVDTLIDACLARLRMVAEAPQRWPTFLREEIGLEGGVEEVSPEAAKSLGVAILQLFLYDELFDGDPEISEEQALALIGELCQRYDLQDEGPTAEDLDQEAEDYDPGRVHGPLEEIAERILSEEASVWLEQGGREQLMATLQHYRRDTPANLRFQG